MQTIKVAMKNTIPSVLKTFVAWRFDSVLDGTFKRNKADFAHHDYPIIAPLPTAGRKTLPIESSSGSGPYIYFVCDDVGAVQYVGKSMEDQIIHRWVRPGVGGPAKHYWTHSTRSGGSVFEIARGLKERRSTHYELRYIPVDNLSEEFSAQFGIASTDESAEKANKAESGFIRSMSPAWNRR